MLVPGGTTMLPASKREDPSEVDRDIVDAGEAGALLDLEVSLLLLGSR